MDELFERLEDWLPLYHEICHDFGFDEAADLECARLLSSLIGDRGREALSCPKLSRLPTSAFLCGGGPSLASELSEAGDEELIVAADGATTVLARHGVIPEIVVTDLDGDVDDQVAANADGSVVFIHAHGDNRDQVERIVPRFTGTIVGTCQCAPLTGLYNFGGFTDGDRAACILAELGVRRIRLAGFDFENPSEKPGRPREVKARKLAWARRILASISDEGVLIESVATGRRLLPDW